MPEMRGLGLIAVQGPDELRAEEEAEAEFEEASDPSRDRYEAALAAHVRRQWSKARRAKEIPEQNMLKSLRQRNGEYDESTKQRLASQGRSTIYMMLTAVKCRAAKAWIRDILMPAGDRPWDLKASQDPSLPEDHEQAIQQRVLRDADIAMRNGVEVSVEQIEEVLEQVREQARAKVEHEAKDKVERMADVIEDQLVEGGWHTEFDRFISDLVDFQAGILKGPVVRHKRELSWAQAQDGMVPDVTDTAKPHVERVDPFRLYPIPGIEDPDEGDVIERHRLTRSDLFELIGLEGYDEDAIRSVLRDHESGALREWLTESTDQAVDSANDQHHRWENDDHIDALEYWGEVPGRVLQEWGIDPMEAPDPERQYPVCVWLVGQEVIKAEMNYDPLGRKPYFKASFERVPGSFWGKGVPDLIADAQRVCNAAARALVDNMGVSSGPQVAINTGSLPPGEDVTQIYPWKIWQLDFSKTNNAQPPINFFQPNPMTAELMEVYERFSRMADDHSGIPAYTYGSGNTGGAGETASGLSMLMNAASKAIKSVISNVDKTVISPLIHSWYTYNMLYNDDPDIKGDAQVVARGAMSLVAKEQVQMRRQEYLQMVANPIDAQIVGPVERAELHREIWKGLDMPADILPDREEMQQRMQQQQEAAAAEQQQQAAVQSAELDPAGDPAGGIPPVAS